MTAVIEVLAWIPRNASFKNELLCRHCAGDSGGEKSRAEQLEELPHKRWAYAAPKNPSRLDRHERLLAKKRDMCNS